MAGPPDGGWPGVERRGDIELSCDLGELGTGSAVAVTLFHPGETQAVLVVAAADLAAVEAPLDGIPMRRTVTIEVLVSLRPGLLTPSGVRIFLALLGQCRHVIGVRRDKSG